MGIAPNIPSGQLGFRGLYADGGYFAQGVRYLDYARRRVRQRESVDAPLVVELVQKERQVQPRIGARKLQVILKRNLEEAGVKIGRDRFLEVLREKDSVAKGNDPLN